MNPPPLSSQFMVREVVTLAEPEDDRVWVPQAPNVWFRPLLLDTTGGIVANLLRIRRGGVYGRHIHNAPVFGYVLRGSWRYLEHDWTATAGAFVFEPPGEVHTLVVDGEHDEMVTYFIVHGGLTTFDDRGHPLKVENVFTKIELCDRYYREAGFGADFIRQFVR